MNITREEVQQVLDAMVIDWHASPIDEERKRLYNLTKAAISLLQSKLAEPPVNDRFNEGFAMGFAAAKPTPMQKRKDYLPPQGNSL